MGELRLICPCRYCGVYPFCRGLIELLGMAVVEILKGRFGVLNSESARDVSLSIVSFGLVRIWSSGNKISTS